VALCVNGKSSRMASIASPYPGNGGYVFLLKKNRDFYIFSVRKLLEYSITVLYNVNCTVQFTNK